MTSVEKEEIREQVKAELMTLEKSASTLTELLNSEVQSDANDWFSTKESNPSKEINEIALAKARQRIVILKNILNRVDTPEFGICVVCNKPIPFGRMKAFPTATRCVSCH
jgi:DnaK suppressor protein